MMMMMTFYFWSALLTKRYVVFLFLHNFITARRNDRIASAVLATAIPSVCLSVCLSVRLTVCKMCLVS